MTTLDLTTAKTILRPMAAYVAKQPDSQWLCQLFAALVTEEKLKLKRKRKSNEKKQPQ
jgi:hypothetical protein